MSSTLDLEMKTKPVSLSRRKEDELSVSLRAQLRAFRERRKWTQSDLAQKLGVARPVVANYEQGVAFPPLPVLAKLAKILEVSLDALVWGEKRASDSIEDRRLLEFFHRADRLHYRTKAALMEIIEAVILKEERDRDPSSKATQQV
jgi:transcriptional regulator with XRE-family HTH domain